ncbi:hypothetical protein [Duganella sp. S19_KUP01_CR8]|uniref:hypothetical protein n=1 Tax=Duganella sp. S19_KUP01_CR8 TaxID=3025502 RepID=UPI002FCD7F5D
MAICLCAGAARTALEKNDYAAAISGDQSARHLRRRSHVRSDAQVQGQDKKQAIVDILNAKDFERLLADRGYQRPQ